MTTNNIIPFDIKQLRQLAERIDRIKGGITRINELMQELRSINNNKENNMTKKYRLVKHSNPNVPAGLKQINYSKVFAARMGIA